MASVPSAPSLPARRSVCLSSNLGPSSRRLTAATVFETELVAIDGVPKPDKIKTKAASDSVAEKVASAVSDAAKTIVADTDDGEAHKEL